MRKLFISLVATVLFVGMVQAQVSAGSFYTGSGSPSLVVHVMKPYAPWASDSTLVSYTGTFNIADFDSIKCFVASYSNGASGKVNFRGSLFVSTGGFQGVPTSLTGSSYATSRNSFDSLGICIDSTETKLKVFKASSIGWVATGGATVAKLQLAPVLSTSTENGTKSVIDIWVVGKKRPYAGPNTLQ